MRDIPYFEKVGIGSGIGKSQKSPSWGIESTLADKILPSDDHNYSEKALFHEENSIEIH